MIVAALGLAGTAAAQQPPPQPSQASHHALVPAPPTRTIDIAHGLDLGGKVHVSQLLFFLERAHEELERSTLERRSFLPHLVRSLDDAAL